MAKVKNNNMRTRRVGSKESPEVVAAKKYVTRIQKNFRDLLRSTNILGLITMADDQDLIEHYFINSKFYRQLLGSSYVYAQRCFNMAVADTIGQDVTAMFRDTKDVYPGIWNEFTIKTLAMIRVRTIMLADDIDAGMYLTANIPTAEETVTTETLKEYVENSYMRFTDYTPLKLHAFCMVVQSTTINRILGEIRDAIPAAMLTNGETIENRFGREFGEVLRNVKFNETYREHLEDDSYGIDEHGHMPDKAMNWQANEFVHLMGQSLLGYATIMLSESGIAVKSIDDSLKESKANVHYSNNAGGKKAKDFVHPWVKMNYMLGFAAKDADRLYGAEFVVCPNDIALVANEVPKDENGKEIVEKDLQMARNRVGKAMLQFLKSLVKYVINTQIFIERRDMLAAAEQAQEAETGESSVTVDVPDPEAPETPDDAVEG